MTSAQAAITETELGQIANSVLCAALRDTKGTNSLLKILEGQGLLPLLRYAAHLGYIKLNANTNRALTPPHKVDSLLAQAASQERARIGKCFETKNITYAYTKGAANAELFGRLSVRVMCDFDILVGEDDFERCLEAARHLGYEVASRSELGATCISRQPYPLALALDIHTQPSFDGQYNFDVASMLNGRIPRGDVFVLAPEDELLFLAAHTSRHRFIGAAKSIMDATVILKTQAIDFDVLAEKAKTSRVRTALWCLFNSCRSIFGVEVPSKSMSAIRPSGLQRAYLRSVLSFNRLSPYRGFFAGGMLRRREALVLLAPMLFDSIFEGAFFLAKYLLRVLRGNSPSHF